MFKKKNQKGFTLVELLVVIAIIGILAVVAVPALFKNINKAKVADLEADYNAIKSATLSYYTDNNTVPEALTGDATTDLDDYMDSVPKKSSVGDAYEIKPSKDGSKLLLEVEGAKLTEEQIEKLINDLGEDKLYTKLEAADSDKLTVEFKDGNLYIVLINNTNM